MDLYNSHARYNSASMQQIKKAIRDAFNVENKYLHESLKKKIDEDFDVNHPIGVLPHADAVAMEQHIADRAAGLERRANPDKDPLVKELIDETASEKSRTLHYDVVDRKGLAKILTEAKKNNQKFKVGKSNKEGYRYFVDILPIYGSKGALEVDDGDTEVDGEVLTESTDLKEAAGDVRKSPTYFKAEKDASKVLYGDRNAYGTIFGYIVDDHFYEVTPKAMSQEEFKKYSKDLIKNNPGCDICAVYQNNLDASYDDADKEETKKFNQQGGVAWNDADARNKKGLNEKMITESYNSDILLDDILNWFDDHDQARKDLIIYLKNNNYTDEDIRDLFVVDEEKPVEKPYSDIDNPEDRRKKLEKIRKQLKSDSLDEDLQYYDPDEEFAAELVKAGATVDDLKAGKWPEKLKQHSYNYYTVSPYSKDDYLDISEDEEEDLFQDTLEKALEIADKYKSNPEVTDIYIHGVYKDDFGEADEIVREWHRDNLNEDLQLYASSLKDFKPAKEAEALWNEIIEKGKLDDLEYELENVFKADDDENASIDIEGLNDLLVNHPDFIRTLIDLDGAPLEDDDYNEKPVGNNEMVYYDDDEEPIDEDAPIEDEEDDIDVDDIEGIDEDEEDDIEPIYGDEEERKTPIKWKKIDSDEEKIPEDKEEDKEEEEKPESKEEEDKEEKKEEKVEESLDKKEPEIKLDDEEDLDEGCNKDKDLKECGSSKDDDLTENIANSFIKNKFTEAKDMSGMTDEEKRQELARKSLQSLNESDEEVIDINDKELTEALGMPTEDQVKKEEPKVEQPKSEESKEEDKKGE